MQETWEMWILSLGWEDSLEEEMTIHSSILAREIPWTEEPSRLQCMGLQKVRQDLVTEHSHQCKDSIWTLWWLSLPWVYVNCLFPLGCVSWSFLTECSKLCKEIVDVWYDGIFSTENLILLLTKSWKVDHVVS